MSQRRTPTGHDAGEVERATGVETEHLRLRLVGRMAVVAADLEPGEPLAPAVRDEVRGLDLDEARPPPVSGHQVGL